MRQAQLESSSYPWAFQEPYDGNRQQLHFVPHFVQKFERNVLAMGIDSSKSGTLYYNRLADPDNLRDNDYTHFFYRNLVQCIEFLMQPPFFREHISYAPAKEFNNAEELIYSEVKWCNW